MHYHQPQRHDTFDQESPRINSSPYSTLSPPTNFQPLSPKSPTSSSPPSFPQANEIDIHDNAAVDSLFRKINIRFVPLFFFATFFSYTDRANLSYAILTMKDDIQLTATQYGIGSSLFFLTYILGGVPGTAFVRWMGARKGLTIVLVAWALASASCALIQDKLSFYICRLILGLTEAPFFPSMISSIRDFYGQKRMAFTYAFILTAVTLSSVFGGPIAACILHFTDGIAEVQGWRFLFILEAMPTLIIAASMFTFFDDKPETARFLNPYEKSLLLQVQQHENPSKIEVELSSIPTDRQFHQHQHLHHHSHHSHGLHVTTSTSIYRRPILYYFALLWIFQSMGAHSLVFWMPLYVKAMSNNSQVTIVACLTAVPFLLASIAMVLAGFTSDTLNERPIHITASYIFGAMGCFLSNMVASHLVVSSTHDQVDSPRSFCLVALKLMPISLGAIGVWSSHGPFFACLSDFVGPDSASTAYAMVNSLGNLGGLLGPMLVGMLVDENGTESQQDTQSQNDEVTVADYNKAIGSIGVAMLLGFAISLYLHVLKAKIQSSSSPSTSSSRTQIRSDPLRLRDNDEVEMQLFHKDRITT